MTVRQLTGLGLMRRLARIVTVIVTLCYLVPGLLSILPSPASAAEQQLYADLMMSRCLDGSNPAGTLPGTAKHDCNTCCILHAVPQVSDTPRLSLLVPITFPDARPDDPVRPELVLATPPSEAVFGPLSQRGPPA